jgi:hypothetical protein
MIEVLKKEVVSTYWICVVLLVLLAFLCGPPLLIMWAVGPMNFMGFLFWFLVWLIVRAGVNKYVL